jgi:polyhydroxyalkanoate synthesis repressor PhaR
VNCADQVSSQFCRGTNVSDDKENIRLIKKYPNRRLYDTETSKYITLDDAREMVVDHVSFKVVDQKTGEDLTRAILLQIIMEQENSGDSMFNTDVLTDFIRNYSEASRENFAGFLQASLMLFNEQQSKLFSQMDKSLQGSPMEFWMNLTRQNMDRFQEMQGQFFGGDKEGGDSKKR